MFKYSCVILGLSLCLYVAQAASVPYGPYQPFESDQQKWEDHSNYETLMHYYHPEAKSEDESRESADEAESGSCAAGNEGELMEPEPEIEAVDDKVFAPSCALEGVEAPPVKTGNNTIQDTGSNNNNNNQELSNNETVENPLNSTVVPDAPTPAPMNQEIPIEKATETPEKATETPEKAAETQEKPAETPAPAVETPEKRETSPYFRPRPNLVPQNGSPYLRYPSAKLATPGKSNQ